MSVGSVRPPARRLAAAGAATDADRLAAAALSFGVAMPGSASLAGLAGGLVLDH